MIDLTVEDVFPLKIAARHRVFRAKAKNGKAINFTTVLRWATAGIRGVKLETVRVGASLCTSELAIHRFVERLSSPAAIDGPTPATAARDHRQAEAELTAAGI